METDRELILAYIYGELNQQQKRSFELRLINDAAFSLLYNQQCKLDKIVKFGFKPEVHDSRMDGVRWALRKKIRQHRHSKVVRMAGLFRLWNSRISFKAQLASMLTMFFLGFIFASSAWVADKNISVEHSVQNNPLKLVGSEDYQITDLQIKRLNPLNGEIQVVYSLSAKTQVSGNLVNEDIQNLLAVTIQNDVNDATRLDLIGVLKDYANRESVKRALSYSLLNDPNPGVRIISAQALARASEDIDIRQVFRKALQNDINPGVRIEALHALMEYLDDKKTLDILESYSLRDSNKYIRFQAGELLQKSNRYVPVVNDVNHNL